MSDSIIEVIDKMGGKRPWTTETDLDKIRQELKIISGEERFQGTIDTYQALKRVVDAVIDGRFNDYRSFFKVDIADLAKEVKKVIAKMNKADVEIIINAHDEKGMTKNEKAVFEFASQIEDVLFRKTIGNKYMSSSENATSMETVSKRAYNMIPLRMSVDGKHVYGYITAPQGIITWQKNIKAFDVLGDLETDVDSTPNLTDQQKERIDKVNLRKKNGELTPKEAKELIGAIKGPAPKKRNWDELSDEEKKMKSMTIKDKMGTFGQLPYKLPLMQNDDGTYKVEMNKHTREILDRYNIMFNDTEPAKKKLLMTVISILKKSKKYGSLGKEEINNLFKYHGVKTFATENTTFWDAVRSLV
jgi:hypothetical protein